MTLFKHPNLPGLWYIEEGIGRTISLSGKIAYSYYPENKHIGPIKLTKFGKFKYMDFIYVSEI